MKLDRLLGILTLLLERDSMTAPELAARFEVNRRTIGRDIDALCRAGIPVVTRQGAGGGISIAEGYKLDRRVLTEDELSSILAALKGIGSVSEPSQLLRTLDKLSPGGARMVSLGDSVVIDLGSVYKNSLTEKIALIRRAIRESRPLAFTYHSERGEAGRTIEPSFVAFQWGAWYLFGYCRERQDWRLFKLTRLWELQMLDEPFSPREIPPGREDFGAQFPDNFRLVALFDPSVKYLLVDAYGPDSFSTEPDGRLRLAVGYTNEEYMLGWVLGFGDRARVLQPQALADRIRRIAKNLLDSYS